MDLHARRRLVVVGTDANQPLRFVREDADGTRDDLAAAS